MIIVEEAEWIEAINRTPSDTALLLVYADYLEEKNSILAGGWRLLAETRRYPYGGVWFRGTGDEMFYMELPHWLFDDLAMGSLEENHVRVYKDAFAAMQDAAWALLRDDGG